MVRAIGSAYGLKVIATTVDDINSLREEVRMLKANIASLYGVRPYIYLRLL